MCCCHDIALKSIKFTHLNRHLFCKRYHFVRNSFASLKLCTLKRFWTGSSDPIRWWIKLKKFYFSWCATRRRQRVDCDCVNACKRVLDCCWPVFLSPRVICCDDENQFHLLPFYSDSCNWFSPAQHSTEVHDEVKVETDFGWWMFGSLKGLDSLTMTVFPWV